MGSIGVAGLLASGRVCFPIIDEEEEAREEDREEEEEEETDRYQIPVFAGRVMSAWLQAPPGGLQQSQHCFPSQGLGVAPHSRVAAEGTRNPRGPPSVPGTPHPVPGTQPWPRGVSPHAVPVATARNAASWAAATQRSFALGAKSPG